MSRPRSSARMAPKHTGDLYSQGYQHQAEREFTIQLGPWDQMLNGTEANYNIAPFNIEDTRRTVVGATGAHLRNGCIYGPGGQNAYNSPAQITNCIGLGSGSAVIASEEVSMFFYRDTSNSDYITVWRKYSGVAGTSHDSTLTSASELIDFTSWGGLVYFTHSGIASVYTYDPLTGAFAAVAGSPDKGEFIFTLDNNMCVVGYDAASGVWQMEWSVDSDPTDWTGAGSGSNIIPHKFGAVYGAVPFGESYLIICRYGAYRVTPTGQAQPAFAFSEEPAIVGCDNKFGVCSGGGTVFYTDGNDYINAYRGGTPVRIEPVDLTYRLWFSTAYQLVIGKGSGSSIKTANPRTLKPTANPMEAGYGADWFADGTWGGNRRAYWFYEDTLNDTVDIYYTTVYGEPNDAYLHFPMINFGTEVEIMEIEIHKTCPSSQLPLNVSTDVVVYADTKDGTTTTHNIGANSIQLEGLNRYPVNIIAETARIRLWLKGSSTLTEEYGVIVARGIRAIRLHCRTVSQSETTRISGP